MSNFGQGTNLREVCSFQTPKATNRVWIGNGLFIAACAIASGVATFLFAPAHYGEAPTLVQSHQAAVPVAPVLKHASTSPNKSTLAAIGPSFDCGKARLNVLRLICETPSLTELDQQLASAYREAMGVSPSPETIRLDERQWLVTRNMAAPDVAVIGKLYTDRIRELQAVVSFAAMGKMMTFRYHDDPGLAAITDMDFREIHADGAITPGTAARFAIFLKRNSVLPGASMVLNSQGGSVLEAIELGKEIREAGLSTTVASDRARDGVSSRGEISGCFSSCTLAFLGGVERTVEPGALFGVHQVSSAASLTANEALQEGQAMIGSIAEYAALMGAKAGFVYELTRATPDGINILSQAKLSNLNVTTPAFQTEWRITQGEKNFYLVATTRTNGGLDHLVVGCDESGPKMLFMFNTSGTYMRDTLSDTTDYGFEFDNTHMDLLPTEVAKPVEKLSDNYVGALIELSPRILDVLQTTTDLTFEMTTPSHVAYAGWTMDFASGRDQFNTFLKSCH